MSRRPPRQVRRYTLCSRCGYPVSRHRGGDVDVAARWVVPVKRAILAVAAHGRAVAVGLGDRPLYVFRTLTEVREHTERWLHDDNQTIPQHESTIYAPIR